MAPESPSATQPPSPSGRGGRGRLRRLGRDYVYVLPGLPVAVLSFGLLLSLTAASLATVVIWLGALLMPVTLLLASAFAELSRKRLRAWGVDCPPVRYRPRRPGPGGVVRLMTDPRRWADLAFEGLLSFPLRLVTFVLAAVWSGVAIGGLTLWIWWRFVPADAGALLPVRWLSRVAPQLVPESASGRYLAGTAGMAIVGLIFLLTLPLVLSVLARLDALVTGVLLGGRVGGRPVGARYGRASSYAGVLPRSRWVSGGIGFAALVLLAVSWPVLSVVYGVHPAVAMLLAVAQSVALVLAIRWPWAGIGLSLLGSLATMLATAPVAAGLPWPWPVTGILTHALLVAFLALRYPWYWASAAWSAGTSLTALAFVLSPAGEPVALANGVVLVSITAALALVGVLERLWRRGTLRARQAEELSAEEAQRRRDLEERNRIARDMHDVVAHSMSVIHVQASTAEYRKPGIDESVQQEFNDIANSARQALGEMRALLAVLRNDDAVPTAPAPTLADIPELVETARASGASITDTIETDAPPTVGLTAYRIVQEGLSNALRHAPGAEIEVTTEFEPDRTALRVTVLNSQPRSDTTPAVGSGLGLAGIRERVSALGGTVEAGETAAGGYRVTAVLPVPGEAADVDNEGAVG